MNFSKATLDEFDIDIDRDITIGDLKKGEFISTSTMDMFSRTLMSLNSPFHTSTSKKRNKKSKDMIKSKLIEDRFNSAIIVDLPFVNTLISTKGNGLKKLDSILINLLIKYNRDLISYILLPCWYNEHWTLYQIDISKKEVCHYDSFKSIKKSDENISKYIKTYCENSKVIKRMYQFKENIEENKIDGKNDLDSYQTISMSTNQQTNGYDCGSFVMINIYAIFYLLKSNHLKLDSVIVRKSINKFIVSNGLDSSIYDIFKQGKTESKYNQMDIKRIFSLLKNSK